LTKDGMEPHAPECMPFARAVYEGLPSPVPPEQSLQVMTILDAIYRSQVEGREIVLNHAEPVAQQEVMRVAA
ncbi:MAG: gfo/Idh/MocA family oxidoreductase, partial [Caldilinea sp.]